MNTLKLLNLRSRNSWRLIALLLGIIFLSLLPFLLVREAITQSQTFAGVKFPNGAISFADEVVSYSPKIELNQQNLPNVKEPFNNPQNALGVPNSHDSKGSLLDLSKRNEVALGSGGSLTLKFTHSLLTGSGDAKPDLWIFGGEDKPESAFVAISKDKSKWYQVGKIDQQNRGIDIDAFGWGKEDLFPYVRLTDDPMQGDHEGRWNNNNVDEWIGWGGTNIDAVGAISCISLGNSAANIFPFSILFSPLSFWLLVTFITGFSLNYFLNRTKSWH